MKTIISLDYNYLMADIIGTNYGIDKKDIDALEKNAVKAATRIRQERERGELVFLDMCGAAEAHPRDKEHGRKCKGPFQKTRRSRNRGVSARGTGYTGGDAQ